MSLFQYTLRLADNAMILGHRLSEWCGHGPILEQDIAMTNIALDLVGQARTLYAYAAELEGHGRTEDDMCFLRDERDFQNVLLVEQPNGHFGDTIARQVYYAAFLLPFYQQLAQCSDTTLAGVAQKGIKEVSYHLRWSGEWAVRLGDGTQESHQRMQQSFNDLWTFTGELFAADALDLWAERHLGIDLEAIQHAWQKTIADIMQKATLTQPVGTFMQKGGKQGIHSENMGYILAEMQYLQRAHPQAQW
jgi:ring-1,2-phenylacetyl-CoA epoxidase subunit PaaC